MDLILWRHAEAEDGINDLNRQLTARGQKQAQQTAAWLRKHLPENFTVIASQAKRSQQTAQALTKDYRVTADINPGCEAAAILASCNWGESNETVVIVGHQPTLGRLASFLLAGTEADWSVKKSAIWWFSNRVRHAEPQTYLKAMLLPELI